MAAAGLLEMTFDFDRSGAQVLTRDQPSDRVVNAPIPRRNRPAEWHRRQTLVKTEEVIALARTD
jgi:hypothetical protein